jgi:hypothetical protein
MRVILANDDAYGNSFKVTDSNAANQVIYSGYIDAHQEVEVQCRKNDSDFGNIVTYQDSNTGVNRSFLHEGERVSL